MTFENKTWSISRHSYRAERSECLPLRSGTISYSPALDEALISRSIK